MENALAAEADEGKVRLRVSIFDLMPALLDVEWEKELVDCTEVMRGELMDKHVEVTIYQKLARSGKKSKGFVSNRHLYIAEEDLRPGERREEDEMEEGGLVLKRVMAVEKVAVLLCHGGYFSGAVFEGKKVVAHKSFHHYVSRKKQGGRQSNKDKSKRAKSGGASIRRHNEDKHQLQVREMLTKWREHLEECDLIFVHLPGRNKDNFVVKEGDELRGDAEYRLSKADRRIRKVPFTTKRPSYKEAVRVFTEVTAAIVTVEEVDEEDLRASCDLRASAESVEFSEMLTDDEEEEQWSTGDEEEEDECEFYDCSPTHDEIM